MKEKDLMNGNNRQQGAGMLTVLLFLVLLGIAALAAMRLVPVYLENRAIASELQTVAEQMKDGKQSQREIWRSLGKRLDINNISYIHESDLTVSKPGEENRLFLDYEVEKPFIGNIDFKVKFKVKTD